MSLLTTYQSCKELIASNLTTQGVEASAEEGLTTLANKILLIQDSNQISQSDIILQHTISIPEELENEITINNFYFHIVGPSYSTQISYKTFRNGEYTIENLKNGRYAVYCNALQYNDPPLKSTSVLYATGILTNSYNLVLKTSMIY